MPELVNGKCNFSVYHAYYLEEMQHDYRLRNHNCLGRYTTDIVYLPKCVPMCMSNNFMPMRIDAIRLNHNGFITVYGFITPSY